MQFTLQMQMYGSIFNLLITWVENIKMKKKKTGQIHVYVSILATVSCTSQTGCDLEESPVCPLPEGLSKQNQPY